MTLASTTVKVQYSGDGSTVEFAVPFVFWNSSEVRVVLTDSDGEETVWTEGTEYTVSGGDGSAGEITVETAPTDYTPAVGERLTIKSNLPDTQGTDLVVGGVFNSEAVEERLDKNVRLTQQQAEEISRSPKLKEGTTSTTPTFPEPDASKVIIWNEAGDDLENRALADLNDLVVPGASADNEIPRFDGTTGAKLQQSGVLIDDAKALKPEADDTGSLGTLSLKWSDLFLASGAVINFNEGDITVTHSADGLDFAGGSFRFPNTGLQAYDTDGSHVLTFAPGSNLTADRTLNFTTGDANRTVTLQGNTTLGDWFDQSVKQAASPTFAGATVNGNISVTGTVDGRDVSNDGTAQDAHIANTSNPHSVTADQLSLGTGDSPQFTAVNIGHASDTTLARASAGDLNVEGNIIYRAGGTDVAVADGGTGASDESGARTNLDVYSTGEVDSALQLTEAIEFVIDGGGSAITTGIKGDLEIPYACTIQRATALADQSGSIVVDIWVDTYANFPPTDADSITASAPVTITTDTDSQDSTLTGWTTSLAAGSIIRFNVDSVTDIERCTVSLLVQRS